MSRVLVCTLLLFGLLAPTAAQDDALRALLGQLDTRNFRQKMQVAEQIAESGHPRAAEILSALAAGNLYIQAPDGRAVIREDRNAPVLDAVTGKPVAEAGKLDKVIVNILMRRQLAEAVARLNLTHPDPQRRLAAAKALYGQLGDDGTAMVRGLIDGEPDPAVREALTIAVALANLKADDTAVQLAAVEDLSGSLANEARNSLRQLADNDAVAPEVREAAAAALARIQSQVRLYDLAEQLFFGLSLGSVLLLAAIGLAITFGVMGVINMAHGELVMLGAYTTYLVQQLMPGLIDWSLVVALPAAFVVAGLFGIVIERCVIRFLYGRALETLLATFGLSLVLQQLVRTTISAQNVPVANPSWMSGSWNINSALSLTWNRLFIIVFALLVFAALVLILKRTSLGLKVRAVTQNRDMARAMGVRTDWVDALTFGLGAGIAGIAGVALSQLTNVGPNLGQNYIVDSFMVVVFGGVGNLWGTLVGALSLGVLNKFLEPWAGAVLAKILVLVFIILFIQKRPRGLFPQKGRAAAGA